MPFFDVEAEKSLAIALRRHSSVLLMRHSVVIVSLAVCCNPPGLLLENPIAVGHGVRQAHRYALLLVSLDSNL
jgi:hypothetical protein